MKKTILMMSLMLLTMCFWTSVLAEDTEKEITGGGSSEGALPLSTGKYAQI